jgi:hypothetical protein
MMYVIIVGDEEQAPSWQRRKAGILSDLLITGQMLEHLARMPLGHRSGDGSRRCSEAPGFNMHKC